MFLVWHHIALERIWYLIYICRNCRVRRSPSSQSDIVECRFNAVQFITIVPMSLSWQQQNLHQISNSQHTPHTSPSQASYGVSVVRILKKIDRVITALHCICKWTDFFKRIYLFSALLTRVLDGYCLGRATPFPHRDLLRLFWNGHLIFVWSMHVGLNILWLLLRVICIRRQINVILSCGTSRPWSSAIAVILPHWMCAWYK